MSRRPAARVGIGLFATAMLLCRGNVLASQAVASLASPVASASASTAPSASLPPRPVTYDLLTFYQDNYVLTGVTNAVEVKLQFSAKYDLWPNDSHHAVYFAFTGKAIWNAYQSSAPFVESNYAPEVFYTYFHHKDRSASPRGCGFFHERVGALHESNGEAGPGSRSWNRLYLESRFACYGDGGLFATASLQAWLPFGLSDNPDITRHLGYGELTLDIGSEGRPTIVGDMDLSVVARKGTNAAISEGSLELSLRWRPPYADDWRFTPHLYVQLFTGYGETLLAYDHIVTALRFGIGLSDTSARSH